MSKNQHRPEKHRHRRDAMYTQAQAIGAELGMTEHGEELFTALRELGYRWSRTAAHWNLRYPRNPDKPLNLTLTDAGIEEARA